MKLRIRQFLSLSYPLLLLASGILDKPYVALVVASFYESGLIGIFLIYVSPTLKEPVMRKGCIALGLTLIIFCLLWIEVFSHTRLLENMMGE